MTRSIKEWSRRRFLHGIFGGGAVTVGLPILDCFLNDSGTAFANTLVSGSPQLALPQTFVTWFWPLGLGGENWTPGATGMSYELPTMLKPLEPFRKRMNLFSGGQVFLDGQANNVHFTGAQGVMTGNLTVSSASYSGSIDTLVADALGAGTRFKSIEVACNGNERATWSGRVGSGMNPAEISPLALYRRIFGPDFKDPNAAEFVPDPKVMARKSVLAAVKDERQSLMRRLGAEDRAKLDHYFTSLRSLEERLQVQLEKPAPLQACSIPTAPSREPSPSPLVTDAMRNHELFVELMVNALACNQTRVFNIALSEALSRLCMEGDTMNHHAYSHEEKVDPVLGYQPKCAEFTAIYMANLASMLRRLDGIREGDGTLLDRTLVWAFTDHAEARTHSVRNYPVITLGNAAGKLKTGVHVGAPGDAVTRVGLTVMLALGVPVAEWGTKSNRTNQPFTEVLA